MGNNLLNIKVSRLHRLENGKFLKAFADVEFNDALVVKGFRVLDGKGGLKVSMPQDQAKDNKWYDSVVCKSDQMQALITGEVLAAYMEESNK